jgi:hypothetical protein
MDAILSVLIIQIAVNFILGYRLNDDKLSKYRRWSYLAYLLLAILSFPLPGILTILSTVKEYGIPDAISGAEMFIILTIGFLIAVTISQLIFNNLILKKIRGRKTDASH